MADGSRVEAEEEADSGFDSLPDEIHGGIMSLLPLKEALKTCGVSTRWKKVTNSMPNLNLNYYDLIRNLMISSDAGARSFMDRVDQILSRRNGSVDKVKIKCDVALDRHRVNEWIVYALSNKVRELDVGLGCFWHDKLDRHLDVFMLSPYQLPIEMFTCNTLEVLTLRVDHPIVLKLPAAPNMVGGCFFPKLKRLHLCELGLVRSEDDDDSIQLRLVISSCSVLEELIVERCYVVHNCKFSVFNQSLKRLSIEDFGGNPDLEHPDLQHPIRIEAPSLVYFKYRCGIGYVARRFVLKNLNSLVHVDIHMDMLAGRWSYYSYSALVDIFQGIGHAQSLNLSGNSIVSVLLLQGDYTSTIPKLPNLTNLNLSLKETYLSADFFNRWETVVSDLLACFPCLQTLDFEVGLNVSNARNIKDTTPAAPNSSLWSHLNRVMLWSRSFQVKGKELQMAEYFLKNAQVLDNFTLQITNTERHESEKRRSEITATLLRLPKISKNCKILVQ